MSNNPSKRKSHPDESSMNKKQRTEEFGEEININDLRRCKNYGIQQINGSNKEIGYFEGLSKLNRSVMADFIVNFNHVVSGKIYNVISKNSYSPNLYTFHLLPEREEALRDILSIVRAPSDVSPNVFGFSDIHMSGIHPSNSGGKKTKFIEKEIIRKKQKDKTKRQNKKTKQKDKKKKQLHIFQINNL